MAQTDQQRENAQAVFQVLLPKLTAQEWGALVEGGDYPTTVAEARQMETCQERRRRESREREEERQRREKLQQQQEREAEEKRRRTEAHLPTLVRSALPEAL